MEADLAFLLYRHGCEEGEALIKTDSFQAVTDVLMGQCVDFQWICQAAITEN